MNLKTKYRIKQVLALISLALFAYLLKFICDSWLYEYLEAIANNYSGTVVKLFIFGTPIWLFFTFGLVINTILYKDFIKMERSKANGGA